MISSPYICKKPLACLKANGEVWQMVIPRGTEQRFGNKDPKRVVRFGAEDVIAQTSTSAVSEPCWIVKEWFKVSATSL